MVDTLGLVLMVVVTAASVPERAGAKLVFARLQAVRRWVHRLVVIWVDGGYQGQDFIRFVIDTYRWLVEPVVRKDTIKGFVPVPQRWKVELRASIPVISCHDRVMNFAIHLDDPLQVLEVFAAQPTLHQTGEWCCIHYGRVLLKDLGRQHQEILCFPWEMHLAWRELVVTIDGKHCFLWRDSFGPEALTLAQAIATQERQVVHQTWAQLQERVPSAKTSQLVAEALNWLQSHRPADLEWFLLTEFDWQIQAHADAIVAAVLQQDTAQLQQVMTAKVSESLMLNLWHPHPCFADSARRLFLHAVEVATERLLQQKPHLIRWLVDRAPAIPTEIQQQLLVKLKLCEVLSGESHGAAAPSSKRRERVHASYKKDATDKSLAGLIQKAIAIVKDGEVLDFEFESTNNPELDAAIRKDLEKVKPNVQLPAGTKDGRVKVRIVFQ